MDRETSLQKLKNQVQNFCEARDWDQYHGAKELAIGVVTEASELLELFRFQTEEQITEFLNDYEGRKKVSEELSDVLFFLLRMSQRYEIDLSESFKKKMESNERRYPASQFKGKNHKSNL